MELQRDFVAEVSTPASAGSGYLIAPRLVLTALHVVLDADRVDRVPAGLTPKVRLNGDVAAVAREADRTDPEWRTRQRLEGWALRAMPDNCWLAGRLVWPEAGAETGDFDLALVGIDGAAASPTAGRDGRAGPVGRILRNQTFCECIGFPDFRRSGDGDGAYHAPALVAAVSAGLDARGEPVDSRAIAVRLQVTTETPRAQDGWRGLSGAAVVSDGRLVSVVHDRIAGTNANNVIGYFPLHRLPPDSPFWVLSGLVPVGAAAAAEEAAFDLARHVADIDREPESFRFSDYLTQAIPPPARDAESPARLVLVPGHAWDELPHLAERLARITAEAFPRAGNAYASMPVLNLGQASTPPDYRLRALFSAWADKLGSRPDSVAGLPLPELQGEVRNLLAADDKPRLALVEHNDPNLTDGCRTVIAALRDFLAALPPSRPPCLVILSVLCGIRCDEVAGIFDKEVWPAKSNAIDALVAGELQPLADDARLCRMDPPSDVARDDVMRWLDVLARARWRPTQDSRRRLDELFPHFQFTPMHSVKRRLDAELQMERM